MQRCTVRVHIRQSSRHAHFTLCNDNDRKLTRRNLHPAVVVTCSPTTSTCHQGQLHRHAQQDCVLPQVAISAKTFEGPICRSGCMCLSLSSSSAVLVFAAKLSRRYSTTYQVSQCTAVCKISRCQSGPKQHLSMIENTTLIVP